MLLVNFNSHVLSRLWTISKRHYLRQYLLKSYDYRAAVCRTMCVYRLKHWTYSVFCIYRIAKFSQLLIVLTHLSKLIRINLRFPFVVEIQPRAWCIDILISQNLRTNFNKWVNTLYFSVYNWPCFSTDKLSLVMRDACLCFPSSSVFQKYIFTLEHFLS